MARTRDTRSPRLQPVVVPALVDGEVTELTAGAARDGERFADISLTGADLTDLVLDGCELTAVEVDGALLDGARLVDSVLDRLTASSVRAARSTWRDVRLGGSRIGAAEFFDAEWLRVEVSGSRIDYLNLSGADLTDVRFADCTIGDLDLRGAKAKRVDVPGCRIGTLSLKDAALDGVDLRGAEIDRIDGAAHLAGVVLDESQLLRFAPLLAEALGIVVEESAGEPVRNTRTRS
jgi:uncharacterized protein YjbI with pentapeptide repeats